MWFFNLWPEQNRGFVEPKTGQDNASKGSINGGGGALISAAGGRVRKTAIGMGDTGASSFKCDFCAMFCNTPCAKVDPVALEPAAQAKTTNQRDRVGDTPDSTFDVIYDRQTTLLVTLPCKIEHITRTPKVRSYLLRRSWAEPCSQEPRTISGTALEIQGMHPCQAESSVAARVLTRW